MPKSYHIPTAVAFPSTSGDYFYNHKCTKPNEILPFGKQHTFFALDQIGEDLIFGTVSFPKEMTPLYPRERCQLKRRNQTHEQNKV